MEEGDIIMVTPMERERMEKRARKTRVKDNTSIQPPLSILMRHFRPHCAPPPPDHCDGFTHRAVKDTMGTFSQPLELSQPFNQLSASYPPPRGVSPHPHMSVSMMRIENIQPKVPSNWQTLNNCHLFMQDAYKRYRLFEQHSSREIRRLIAMLVQTQYSGEGCTTRRKNHGFSINTTHRCSFLRHHPELLRNWGAPRGSGEKGGHIHHHQWLKGESRKFKNRKLQKSTPLWTTEPQTDKTASLARGSVFDGTVGEPRDYEWCRSMGMFAVRDLFMDTPYDHGDDRRSGSHQMTTSGVLSTGRTMGTEPD
ncbi:uncharacterized protein BO96DRAFT_350610 [Aspergillus niger CBS 101883]|uniref:uncharacterized protein n=1 Tax=Aspergillus lacticoffeatus (strain CBS 101883) TaxID=1450533 RepID=UPI000D7F7A5E|nr:uncharacterized protein BO96DRAFT_350610 [Aspergillus niger CBS 101883]PYH51199.1 hypothetical protein BO96DRAFT_350610 [Aspergillus niger CBS 101883]